MSCAKYKYWISAIERAHLASENQQMFYFLFYCHHMLGYIDWPDLAWIPIYHVGKLTTSARIYFSM